MKSQNIFQELQPAAYLSKENLELRGAFWEIPGKDTFSCDWITSPPISFPLLIRITHLLLDEASDETPLWLDEGLAELYGNTRIYDRKVLLGEPNQHHLMLLRSENLLPLDTCLRSTRTRPITSTRRRARSSRTVVGPR